VRLTTQAHAPLAASQQRGELVLCLDLAPSVEVELRFAGPKSRSTATWLGSLTARERRLTLCFLALLWSLRLAYLRRRRPPRSRDQRVPIASGHPVADSWDSGKVSFTPSA